MEEAVGKGVYNTGDRFLSDAPPNVLTYQRSSGPPFIRGRVRA